jgi:hypothetical protein
MGFTVGPVRPQAQGTPVGMLPGGFMMGGGRQMINTNRSQFEDEYGVVDEEAWKKAVAKEKAENETFFGGIDNERQAMMPFWMR